MIAIDTKVKVIDGWKTIGTLEVGDKVFDEQGNVVDVTEVSKAIKDKIGRVRFNDTSYIESSLNSPWITWNQSDFSSYKYQQKTQTLPRHWANYKMEKLSNSKGLLTEEIVETVLVDLESGMSKIDTYRKNGVGKRTLSNIISGKYKTKVLGAPKTLEDISKTVSPYAISKWNHFIPNNFPLKCEEQNLPINPWLFGYMLGDATTAPKGRIACDYPDKYELIDRFNNYGYECSDNLDYPRHFRVMGTNQIWKDLNLPNGKYVPNIYMNSSINQRWDLLSGLISSDGCVSKGGFITFHNTNKLLIDSFIELCNSLGIKTGIQFRKGGFLYGRNCKDNWTVVLSHNNEHQLDLLSRKQTRIGVRKAVTSAQARMITGVDFLDESYVRKLKTSSKNSLILLGTSMVPVLV